MLPSGTLLLTGKTTINIESRKVVVASQRRPFSGHVGVI